MAERTVSQKLAVMKKTKRGFVLFIISIVLTMVGFAGAGQIEFVLGLWLGVFSTAIFILYILSLFGDDDG